MGVRYCNKCNHNLMDLYVGDPDGGPDVNLCHGCAADFGNETEGEHTKVELMKLLREFCKRDDDADWTQTAADWIDSFRRDG